MPARANRIGIFGDFNPEYQSHHATNSSLQHAARALGCAVEFTWIATPGLAGHVGEALADYDGLWASAGSPYRSMSGMLAGIEWARTHSRPFVAT